MIAVRYRVELFGPLGLSIFSKRVAVPISASIAT